MSITLSMTFSEIEELLNNAGTKIVEDSKIKPTKKRKFIIPLIAIRDDDDNYYCSIDPENDIELVGL